MRCMVCLTHVALQIHASWQVTKHIKDRNKSQTAVVFSQKNFFYILFYNETSYTPNINHSHDIDDIQACLLLYNNVHMMNYKYNVTLWVAWRKLFAFSCRNEEKNQHFIRYLARHPFPSTIYGFMYSDSTLHSLSGKRLIFVSLDLNTST